MNRNHTILSAMCAAVLVAGCGSGTSVGGGSSPAPAPSANPPVASGTATLSWTVPSKNADGSDLQDLSGFRIFYGSDPNNLNSVITVADASATGYTISDLAPGTYYFAIRSYAASGAESDATMPVSKAIP